MRRMTTVFVSAVAALVAGVGFATSSNAQDVANDQAYCKQLLKELRDVGWGTVRGNPVGNATAVAIAQCEEGDPGPAIPVLEQQMRERDITLPPRR